ncbi:hypothetical protein PACTADRAFT_38758 [Pachysolen tannophilus NRRL Y-2460]|uniref:MTHFR SAM-binding regulatory domain-containing protein n=1 Tax=Pachysolen tannophilus NRRL Y-2460 TaxID=669874 RepID=A0A1E4U086_PACTA|nr:hypothetical protein PACTADRAFT_38758 [Pachysolen tannophilus NRRL Y-2460]
MKITEKLNKAHDVSNAPPATFSFEFFVPKTSQGVQNLYSRMDRMYQLNPQFIDITWNAGGVLSNLTTEMVNTSQSVLGLETCMHLTCTNMSLEVIDNALKSAYDSGCQNILALRGDPPIDGSESTGTFKYSKDLIKYIKTKYGDHFNIGVAAYPEGHAEEGDADKLIDFLKEKQDCGGDFIVTQMFYNADIFIEWCKKIRAKGITLPIIPGIMPIATYASFMRRAKWCEINVPENFLKELELIKDDDAKVRLKGCELVSNMCLKLLKSGYVNHLHFYTMNLEKSTIMVLEYLNLIQPNLDINSNKLTPWRKSLNPTRSNETVRPIFWANRKFSYIERTNNWDEFPNGRWGDSRSPAFGEVDLFHNGLIRHSAKKTLELWGRPTKEEQLSDIFIKYLKGEIKSLPWSDDPISPETNPIVNELIDIIKKGYYSINSQPCINGLPSSDKINGWGPKNGYVYQKMYLEFLCPASKAPELLRKIDSINSEFQTGNCLTYYAVNSRGELSTNSKEDDINAVTWGVFPGSEVLQPTIVEKISFLAWKDEVFKIINEWQGLYNSDSKEDAEVRELLSKLHDEFYLVNIVDNRYADGKSNDRIFGLFD